MPFCPQCRSEYDSNDHFCTSCGHKLSQEKVEQEGQTGKIRKHVAVLVADIKSPDEMTQNLDAEGARELLFPAVQKLSSIVYEYGGLVISTAGDGLTAVFGAAQLLEHYTLRACIAALAMQKQIKSFRKELAIRIGLSTGDAIVEFDGAKYDVSGPVLTLAVRIKQTAAPGTIRLTENTLKLVAENVTAESLGSMQINGFNESMKVFELKSVKITKTLNELESQFVAGSPFVNREQELAKVNSLLEAAKAGKGNTVCLFADTGFGKSRFIHEVIHSDSAKNCNILFTAGFIHTKDISLSPITHLFRTLFGISDDEIDVENIKKQILPFLTHIESPQALNAALSLINFSPNHSVWISLEPGLKRRYMFEVGVKLLCNYASEKPLIFIIEDLHWIDSETEMFLDAFLSQTSQLKIFTLISYRLDYHDHFTNKPNYTRIPLIPLSKDAGSKMLDNLLGSDPSLSEIKTRLLISTEGNPFFLEELVSSLISEKVFVGKPNNYLLSEGTSITKLSLPETIAAIVQTRIDHLRPIEKKILQTASIIGTKFAYSHLIQLMDPDDEGEVRIALKRLIDTQYLYESQLFPEQAFAFTHALTSETAYNSLLKKTRKSLHEKLFQILESTLSLNQLDQMQVIAEHAFLGECWEKAFYYCSNAAQKIYDINAFSSAVKLYEKALIAGEHLPQDDVLMRKIMRIHYELYCALVPLGRFNEQYTYLEKALEIALAKKDRFFESILNAAFAIHSLGYKDANTALKYSEKAYLIAKEVRSTDAIVISQTMLAHCYLFVAQFKDLFAITEELENTIGGDLDYRTDWLRAPLPHLARYYEFGGRALTGDFITNEVKKEKWFSGSQNFNEPSIANLCRFAAMGAHYYVKGDFEKAIPFAETALKLSKGAEVIVYIPIFLSILGEIYARTSKLKEAKEYIDQAIAIVEKLHGNFTTIFSFVAIPNCLLALGEGDKAKEFCNKALALLKERNVKVLYPALLRTISDIELSMPDPNYSQIKQQLEDALQLATQQGALPTIAHCHLELSKLYQKTGDTEGRKNALNSALSQYEKLGMPYWTGVAKKLG